MDVAYPGFGVIEIDGIRYDHDVIIDGGAVRRRDKGPSKALRARTGHTPLSAAEDLPWGGQTLIVGTGYSGRLPVLDGVRTAAAERGIDLVTAPTADVVATLQSMAPGDVYAVLHVTC